MTYGEGQTEVEYLNGVDPGGYRAFQNGKN